MNDIAARALANALEDAQMVRDHHAREVETYTDLVARHMKARDEAAERVAALEEALGEDAERLLATPLGEVLK